MKNGKHKMAGGKMMSDKEMEKMMKKMMAGESKAGRKTMKKKH